MAQVAWTAHSSRSWQSQAVSFRDRALKDDQASSFEWRYQAWRPMVRGPPARSKRLATGRGSHWSKANLTWRLLLTYDLPYGATANAVRRLKMENGRIGSRFPTGHATSTSRFREIHSHCDILQAMHSQYCHLIANILPGSPACKPGQAK